MTDYTITTNFGAKDSLPSGNAAKVIKGSEFTTEFTNIATAVNSKADKDGATFTGNITFDTNTLFVDASTNRVGMGTTSADHKLHVHGGDIMISSDTDTSTGDGKPALLFSEENPSNTDSDDAMAGIVYDGDGQSNNANYLGLGVWENNEADQDTLAEQKATTTLNITRDNKVGIGTSSPDTSLHVVAGAEGEVAQFTGSIENRGLSISIETATDASALTRFNAQSGGSAGQIAFDTDSNERMRIDSSGNVLIGTTDTTLYSNNASGANSSGVAVAGGGSTQIAAYNATPLYANRMATSGTLMSIRRAGTQVGYIWVNTNSTVYSTTSDERLKENIADSADAGSKIDAIQIRQFDWISNGEHQDYGVIAQELINVVPSAVAEGDTEEDMMGVDYSKLVPLLVKEVQALRSRVAQLEESV